METMMRDPLYIAGQVKLIRKMNRLTQENLADAAGLSTRTIEKIESGRHRPDEQTLRSIARAMQLNVSCFEKPSPEREEWQKAEMLRALKKTVVTQISPIRNSSEFLSAFGRREAFRIDTSEIASEAALDTAAAMADWIRDMGDVWEDSYMSQRLEYAREFVNLCHQIEEMGFVCYMGKHSQQLPKEGGSPIIFTVGLMAFLPKDEANARYAIVKLEGGWETSDDVGLDLE